MPEPELLSYTDIARLTGVREATLRNYARRGYMPAPDVMLADRPRWTRAAVEDWLRQRSLGRNTRRGG